MVFVMQPLAFAYTAEERRNMMLKDIIFVDDEEACGENNLPGEGDAVLDGHTLPASKGGTGFEEVINERGQVPSTGGYVTFSENVRSAPTAKTYQDPRSPDDPSKKVSMQDLYRMYYITMRWRYVTWNWDGSSTRTGPEDKDFYAKAPRVQVTNPRTGKTIIAVVLEAGPGPWTGVDRGSNNDPKQGWKNPQDGTPRTYKGRVSGFPPQAIKDLDATMRMSDGSGDDLIYSWARDQSAAPGPVEGTSSDGDSGESLLCSGDIGLGGAQGNLFRSASEPCAVGDDQGIQDGYTNGKMLRIRICKVQGIRVNTLVAEPVNNMLNLAKSQGHTFTGGGFRTMAEQIATRRANGCPDIYKSPSSACRTATARPGYSNHQMGLALDLSYKGDLIRSRSNNGFRWLDKNAASFGFKNFPVEPWHWSVNGK
jgi:hypothetical protein